MENGKINISLITSTSAILTSSNRMLLGLTDEINFTLSQNKDSYKEVLPLKNKQLKRLSLSIVLMYISLALLVVNALLKAVNLVSSTNNKILIIESIMIFLAAILYKIQFSSNAYKIRKKQFSNFLND